MFQSVPMYQSAESPPPPSSAGSFWILYMIAQAKHLAAALRLDTLILPTSLKTTDLAGLYRRTLRLVGAVALFALAGLSRRAALGRLGRRY